MLNPQSRHWEKVRVISFHLLTSLGRDTKTMETAQINWSTLCVTSAEKHFQCRWCANQKQPQWRRQERLPSHGVRRSSGKKNYPTWWRRYSQLQTRSRWGHNQQFNIIICMPRSLGRSMTVFFKTIRDWSGLCHFFFFKRVFFKNVSFCIKTFLWFHCPDVRLSPPPPTPPPPFSLSLCMHWILKMCYI